MIVIINIIIISILFIYVLFFISVIPSRSAIIIASIIIQMKQSLIFYYADDSLLLLIGPSYVFSEDNYFISYLFDEYFSNCCLISYDELEVIKIYPYQYFIS